MLKNTTQQQQNLIKRAIEKLLDEVTPKAIFA